MKALRIYSRGEVELFTQDAPTPSPGEILLRMLYVGFCGSDLNTYRGRNAMALDPVIPGHEIGAQVVALGGGVPSSFKVGDIVTVIPYTSCGKCPSCLNHRENACRDNETLGVQRNGAMREYICLPWQKVLPSGGLDPTLCALIEPMSVGFHAVRRAGVGPADSVMVIGCGMVGMGAIMGAYARGAKVIAADIDDEKLSEALTLGASHSVNTLSPSAHQTISDITGGDGPSVIIEAVGSVPTYRLAIQEVAFTGRVACIGYAPTDVAIPTGLIVKKELDVRGSRNAMPEDFAAVRDFLSSTSFDVSKLISKVVSPEEAPSAMKEWASDPGKVFRILVQFQ